MNLSPVRLIYSGLTNLTSGPNFLEILITSSSALGGPNRWQGKALHIQGKITDKADNDRSHVAPVSVPLLPMQKEAKHHASIEI